MGGSEPPVFAKSLEFSPRKCVTIEDDLLTVLVHKYGGGVLCLSLRRYVAIVGCNLAG